MEASATGSFITVNIDGKPLEKLIEVVSNGIGTLYRPRKIRKEADAEAYAIKVLEKAKAEAGADSMLAEADTIERIGKRLVAQEIRRQNNIDTIVEAAAEDLKGKDVSEDPVSEDWATRFFGIVQDVSQEEMKVIWSKILAKEIERPSTFSMRTLETLRNLSAEEANLFVKIAPFVMQQNSHFIFNESDALSKCGIHYVDIAKVTYLFIEKIMTQDERWNMLCWIHGSTDIRKHGIKELRIYGVTEGRCESICLLLFI